MTLCQRQWMVDQELADALLEARVCELLGQRDKRVGSHAGAVDEGADHGIGGQRRRAEDPSMQDRRVDRMRLDQAPAAISAGTDSSRLRCAASASERSS
jgi:hypothetical protein